MEEKQTRVNLYMELRDEIDRMDTYSFSDPNRRRYTSSSEVPIVHEEAMSEEEVQSGHIKKNTLSISIDELIKQHDEYTSSLEKKELSKKYKEVKKKHRSVSSFFDVFKRKK